MAKMKKPMNKAPGMLSAAGPQMMGGPPDPNAQPDGTQTPDDTQTQDGGTPDQENGADDSSEGEQATPEEQQQYDEFVNNCYNAIYTEDNPPKVQPSILQGLANKSDPITGLADTSAAVVHGVVANAAKNGVKIDPSIILHGGMQVIADLVKVAKLAKIYNYTPKEQEAATYRAVDMYRQMQGNDPQAQQAAQQDLSTMQQANASGNLDSVLPGATEAAQHFEKGAKQ